MSARIPRIGREPTPAERSLRYATEDKALREHVSRNYYGHVHEIVGTKLEEVWAALSPAERDRWVSESMDVLRVHAISEQDQPPTAPTRGAD